MSFSIIFGTLSFLSGVSEWVDEQFLSGKSAHYRVARKKRAELCITITVRYVYFMNEISSGTLVDHYVLLLNYKFQWRH